VEKREKALNLLGLAYRARKLINGDEVVTDNLQKGKCKMVIVASDASNRTIDKFQKKCFFYGTELNLEFTTEEISKALGKGLVKVVALLDEGFSNAFKENLRWGELDESKRYIRSLKGKRNWRSSS